MCVSNENCLWIRCNHDDGSNSSNIRKSIYTILYMSGRLERGKGVYTLALLQHKLMPFWGMLASLRSIRWWHPLRGDNLYWCSWFITRIMLGKFPRSILIFGTNPHRRIFILLLDSLVWRGGGIYLIYLIYNLAL